MSEADHEPVWHAWPGDEALRRTGGEPAGLGPAAVARQRTRYGSNELTSGRRESPARLAVRQLASPLVYLLLGAAGLAIATGHAVDAAVIGGVVVLNLALGVAQEWRAERALAALRRLAAPRARVRRQGREQVIPAEQVVPGDLLLLARGDRVAADARILEADDLALNESALTGESEPVFKRPEAVPAESPLAERRSMVWMTTGVVQGRGQAVAVATGMRTAVGRIAEEVQGTDRALTPLQRRLRRLALALSGTGLGLAGLVLLLGVLRGHGWSEMALYAVAAAVAAIPEGLPAVVSVTLALGVRRMARHQAIVRRLPAVETLGSTTVICTDKTGTLTQNEMTATRVWAGGRLYSVAGRGYGPQGELRNEAGDRLPPDPRALPEAVRQLLTVGSLANDSTLVPGEGQWQMIGSPTEGALLSVALKAGLDPAALRAAQPRVGEIPFTSERQYMAAAHRRSASGDSWVVVKGAPERLLAGCTHLLLDGRRVALDAGWRAELERIDREFAADALRVIAGAFRELPAGVELRPELAESGLTLAGLWALVDPPRADVVESIRAARGAGIQVVMVTGDHPVTAAAVARQVGLVRAAEVLAGPQLEALPDEALVEHVQKGGVFARVTPSHKRRILTALRARGAVVAMTGDGVNDAPALKAADIGVAMGRSGTEVAKEAADLVLTDDNFATIVHAVEQGRVIFANLQRAVFFLVTTNLGEVLVLLGALLIGMPLPLSAIMLLWINLVTDGLCVIPLGLEPRHRNVLWQPPRRVRQGLFDAPLLTRALVLAPLMAAGTLGVFAFEQATGNYAHATTAAFCTLAAFQWLHALNARTSRSSLAAVGALGNRWLNGALLAAIALQLAAVYTPLGQAAFGTRALGLAEWGVIALTAASILVADELLKFGLRTLVRRRVTAGYRRPIGAASGREVAVPAGLTSD